LHQAGGVTYIKEKRAKPGAVYSKAKRKNEK
jgi:hypothetical protein